MLQRVSVPAFSKGLRVNHIQSVTQRLFSSNEKPTIHKPTLAPNAQVLLDKYPKHTDNRMNIEMPKSNFNPYATSSDHMDEGLQMLHNIAPPLIKKPSDPTSLADAPTSNIGVVGRLDNPTYQLDRNRMMCSGFGAGTLMVQHMSLYSSAIILPDMVFAWTPDKWSEVTPESLSILNFIYPAPDLLIFGCGTQASAVDPSVHHFLKTLNIPYELLSTNSAMGTFNLMNEEFRKVIACIIRLDSDEHRDYERHNATRFQS